MQGIAREAIKAAASGTSASSSDKEYASAFEDAKLLSAELERQKLQEEINSLKQDNKNKKGNRRLRRDYANKVFLYLAIYSAISAIIVFLNGFQNFPFGIKFQLDPVIVTTLIGSTAVAAIGLVLAVVNGLFKDIN